MRLRPLRGLGQTLSATDAVAGAVSLRTTQQTPGAPSAQRSTPCRTTDALWKGVGPDKATGALMLLPNAPIARALMGCGLMPVQPRRRPDNSRGGGDPPRVSTGRRGPAPRPLRHLSARSPQGEGEVGEAEVAVTEEGGPAQTEEGMELGE